MEPSRRRTAREAEGDALVLALERAASPELVRDVAAMFAESIAQLDPRPPEGSITLVIVNFATKTSLRAWDSQGKCAVTLLAALVENPTTAVQEHPELAATARALAGHARLLAGEGARFFRQDRELVRVDQVFVRTMRAAGQV